MRNPISIELLETLDTIDRRGSFAKAALELNKATSALSYLIQKAEEQLGIALFERQGRRSVLTPAGLLVLDEGRHILHNTAWLADKAREVATGWETKLSVGLESAYDYPRFFAVLREFLDDHSHIEVDVVECVLNGGWDALAEDRVDLIVGTPGPVPLQMGYRAVPMYQADMLPVITASHPLAEQACDEQRIEQVLPSIRRVINRDTSVVGIARSAGFSDEGKRIYVQTMEQKAAAIVAGLGAGHLPRKRVQALLDSGELRQMAITQGALTENFLAWKISHKGRGLRALTQLLQEHNG
ncbi:HTH-type transcriptional regulator YhaJ [BD1-7 clade bacterium]|uniref:HTH-type transcriptional regulator YhaJ n=1 Tax=BD1-7 clade bacterium TaxID=2029982 RepID=A0A5S9Q414_9GAMM|nr:HTH-type transcriptional regulator YhaJ [BD1-7 clade bacterium]